METIIMPMSDDAINMAVNLLEKGEVIIFPSENVYGMFTNALCSDAVKRIYELKGRDEGKPLGFVTNRFQATKWGHFDANATKALDLWPGGLTIIVPKKDSVPDYITAGFRSVLLTCPDKYCHQLAEAAPFPIACTSANLSGQPGIVTGKEAAKVFTGKVPLIVDGGETARKVNGTIIDFSRTNPTVLRIGALPLQQLQDKIPGLTVADKMI